MISSLHRLSQQACTSEQFAADPKHVRQPLHMFKQRNDWPVIPFLRRSHPGLREGTEEVGRPVLRDGGGPAENGLRGLGQAHRVDQGHRGLGSA